MQFARPRIAAAGPLAAAAVIVLCRGALSLPDTGLPAIQLTAGEDTSASLTDLLNTAGANYADAYNVANSMFTDDVVPVGSTGAFGLDAAQVLNVSQAFGQIVGDLARDQAALDAHAGALSGLLDQFWFAPLDQEEVSFSEAMLQGIQSLDTALQAYDVAATPANTFALDAAEQSINALNWETVALDWQTNFLFDVANFVANPGF